VPSGRRCKDLQTSGPRHPTPSAGQIIVFSVYSFSTGTRDVPTRVNCRTHGGKTEIWRCNLPQKAQAPSFPGEARVTPRTINASRAIFFGLRNREHHRRLAGDVGPAVSLRVRGGKSPRGNSPLGDESLLGRNLTLHTRQVAQETAKEGRKDRLGPIHLVPARLVSGLVRTGAGALIGHLHEGMSRSDLKEMGEFLHQSEAASIVAGDDRAGCWGGDRAGQQADDQGGQGTSEGNRVGDRQSVASRG
jgi:hypothetical protein